MNPEDKFKTVASGLEQHQGVSLSKITPSPELHYNGKSFAFFHQDEMVFRLGKEWNPEEDGILKWKNISPLNKDEPLNDWFSITAKDADLWPILATQALSRMISGK